MHRLVPLAALCLLATLPACRDGRPTTTTMAADAAASPPRDTVVFQAVAPVDSAAVADSLARLAHLRALRERPGYAVDSAIPMPERIRRFRRGVPAVTALGGAAPSREALADRFRTALARRDTAALARLAVTRAEFAWLVFPNSAYARPPFEHPPELAWAQLQSDGAAGFRRLLERLGGRTLPATAPRCAPTPGVEGELRLWRDCRVAVVRAPRDTAWARLFGVIVEHRGGYKLASYANDF